MDQTTPETQPAIAVSNLTKSFGDVVAVNGLNLEIRKGGLFGFLGPNGAGKTTTIKILCGLVEPTAGSVKIAGLDVAADARSVRGL